MRICAPWSPTRGILIVGTGENTSVGSESAPPVDRVFTGKRTPLPALNTLDVGAIPSEAQPAQGGANAGQ